MKYEIITSTEKGGLSDLINRNLTLGWILKGGVTTDNGVYAQAIGHPSDGDHKPYTGEDTGIDIEGMCTVCGEVDCDSKLHAELSSLTKIIKELLRAKDKI
jgi:hypothetical protein